MRLLITVIMFIGSAVLLSANPSGADVVSGTANITINGSTLTIENSNKAIINWQDFSIKQGEVTEFKQASSSAVLNRVVGGNLSEIYGELNSQGQVYLINPQGVFVGESGVVNTGGFIASTLDVRDSDFLDGGDLSFTGDSSAKVINLGEITAGSGDVILIARQIENAGSISAPNGLAGLYAGQEVLLSTTGDGAQSVRISSTESDADGVTGIDNSGTISAAKVQLQAAEGNIYSLAVKNSGLIEAQGTEEIDGVVYIGGGGNEIENSGVIRAQNFDGSGGKVVIESEALVAEEGSQSSARIKSSGVIDVSGGYNNKYDTTRSKTPNSSVNGGQLYIKGASLSLSGDVFADGTLSGGTIDIDVESASLAGMMSVTGDKGDGGYVEIYAYKRVDERAGSSIDVSGANGGQIYIDGGTDYRSSANHKAVGSQGDGGGIHMTAKRMQIKSGINDASGKLRGGIIRAGGDLPGGGDAFTPDHISSRDMPGLSKANTFRSSKNVVMKADGLMNGGVISVWGSDSVIAGGQYSARGQEGGLIDFSSERNVTWNSTITDIDPGTGGTFRLDPKNIRIQNGGSSNVGDSFSVSAGSDSVISPDDIKLFLDNSQNVVLQANNDITLDSNMIVRANGNGGDLTLQAGRSIHINRVINTDSGDLNIFFNDINADGIVLSERDAGTAVATVDGLILTGAGSLTIEDRGGSGSTGGGSNVYAPPDEPLPPPIITVENSGPIVPFEPTVEVTQTVSGVIPNVTPLNNAPDAPNMGAGQSAASSLSVPGAFDQVMDNRQLSIMQGINSQSLDVDLESVSLDQDAVFIEGDLILKEKVSEEE